MLSIVKGTVLFSLFEHWLQASVYWITLGNPGYSDNHGYQAYQGNRG